MSKKENYIKDLIEYFMDTKEPIFVDHFSWRNVDEQQAVIWLRNKKFIRIERYGKFDRVFRSSYFYKIYDEIKDLTTNEIISFLKENSKKGKTVKVLICPHCGSEKFHAERLYKNGKEVFQDICKDCDYTSEESPSRSALRKHHIYKEVKY